MTSSYLCKNGNLENKLVDYLGSSDFFSSGISVVLCLTKFGNLLNKLLTPGAS